MQWRVWVLYIHCYYFERIFFIFPELARKPFCAHRWTVSQSCNCILVEECLDLISSVFIWSRWWDGGRVVCASAATLFLPLNPLSKGRPLLATVKHCDCTALPLHQNHPLPLSFSLVLPCMHCSDINCTVVCIEIDWASRGRSALLLNQYSDTVQLFNYCTVSLNYCAVLLIYQCTLALLWYRSQSHRENKTRVLWTSF